MFGFWCLCAAAALLGASHVLLDAENEWAQWLGLLAGALSCPAIAFFLIDLTGVRIQ